MRPYFTLHIQIMGHNTFSIIKGIWKSSVTRNLALNIEYLLHNTIAHLLYKQELDFIGTFRDVL